jgi:hypothetical protein
MQLTLDEVDHTAVPQCFVPGGNSTDLAPRTC